MPRGATHEYTQSSDYPVKFGKLLSSGDFATYPNWLQVIGPGVVVVKNEDTSIATFVCDGGEVIPGTFIELLSITSTRVRMGNGPPPSAVQFFSQIGPEGPHGPPGSTGPTGSQGPPGIVPARFPVYRLRNSAEHFYTIDPVERDNAVSQYGYTYEGIAFYAFKDP